jgi:hypothetical protein
MFLQAVMETIRIHLRILSEKLYAHICTMTQDLKAIHLNAAFIASFLKQIDDIFDTFYKKDNQLLPVRYEIPRLPPYKAQKVFADLIDFVKQAHEYTKVLCISSKVIDTYGKEKDAFLKLDNVFLQEVLSIFQKKDQRISFLKKYGEYDSLYINIFHEHTLKCAQEIYNTRHKTETNDSCSYS